MKRLLLVVSLLSLCVAVDAQTLSVESFRAVENDMDARVNEPRLDLNGRKAALIKIETTEKGFGFDVGQLGIVDVEQDKIAQVWVYIPQGAIRIEILHPQLGSTIYEFPIAIKEATVYRLKLTTGRVYQYVEEDAGGSFFILRTEPEQVSVAIDGNDAIAVSGGSMNQFLTYGEHTYTVSAPMYEPYSETITIGKDRVDRSVELSPAYGYISINTTPTSSVVINGMNVGSTPYNSNMLSYGTYTVHLSAPGCTPISREVTLSSEQKSVDITETLASDLTHISVTVPLDGTSIYINGEKRGDNSWSGVLMPGEYIISCEKEGHRESLRKVVVERGAPQTIELDAPTPTYGKLRVSSQIIDVDVAIGGVSLGTAPDTFSDILVGKHNVTYSKSGYESKSEEVEIREGRITNTTVALLPARVVATTPRPATTPTQRPATTPTQRPATTPTQSPTTPKISGSTTSPDITAEVEPQALEPTKKRVGTRVLMVGVMGYHPSQISYGGMFGILGKVGVYGKYTSNFMNVEHTMLCEDSGMITGFIDGYSSSKYSLNDYPAYNQDVVYTERESITAGLTVRLARPLHLYLGGGVGSRSLVWETNDGYLVQNENRSYDDLAFDAGGVLKMGPFGLTVGWSTIGLEYHELNVGFGFMF